MMWFLHQEAACSGAWQKDKANDRVWHYPHSMHSSTEELESFVNALHFKEAIPFCQIPSDNVNYLDFDEWITQVTRHKPGKENTHAKPPTAEVSPNKRFRPTEIT